MIARPRLVEIKDERGRWVAEVEGRWLAVLADSHWNFHNKVVHAPILHEDQGSARLRDLLDALQAHDLIVMRRDQTAPKGKPATKAQGNSLAQSPYIGVFRFKGLEIRPDSFTLTIVERYASPTLPGAE